MFILWVFFTDEGFIKSLTENKNLFQRIFDEVKYFCSIAVKGSNEETQLLKIKHAFEKALGESREAKVSGETGIQTDNFALDKYSKKQYNQFGWARDIDAISKNELDDMYSKIHEKGSLTKFPKSSTGEAIIEVNDKPHTTLGTDNVFVFVTGTRNSPQIDKVVRFQVETDAEMEIIKEKLYERGTFRNTYYWFLEQYGIAREYSKKSALDYTRYEEKIRRRSGGAEGNRAYGDRGIEQNGTRSFEETRSNEIAPDRASSTDGAFLDGEKNGDYSLSGEADGDIAPVDV